MTLKRKSAVVPTATGGSVVLPHDHDGLNGKILHYPSLGPLHGLSITKQLDESMMNSIIDENDIRNMILTAINNTADNVPYSNLSLEDIIRSRQAETFIALVLDVRRLTNGTNTHQDLSSPALYALQMLLLSDWNSKGFCFPPEFLEALVSFLTFSEGNPKKSDSLMLRTYNQNNGNGDGSSCSIAEELLSTIFKSIPSGNASDGLLDDLFHALKNGANVVHNDAKLNILSQVLGKYISLSLPNLGFRALQQAQLSSQHAMLGENKAKADTNWRKKLGMGDVVQVMQMSDTSHSQRGSKGNRWVTGK